MDNIFDLRDEEFREYFFAFLPHDFKVCNKELLSSMSSGRFTNKDLARLCFELSFYDNSDDIFNLLDVESILFNYKMERISEERVDNFRQICREMHKLTIHSLIYIKIKDYFLVWECDGINKFNKLMDIFLDEI